MVPASSGPGFNTFPNGRQFLWDPWRPRKKSPTFFQTSARKNPATQSQSSKRSLKKSSPLFFSLWCHVLGATSHREFYRETPEMFPVYESTPVQSPGLCCFGWRDGSRTLGPSLEKLVRTTLWRFFLTLKCTVSFWGSQNHPVFWLVKCYIYVFLLQEVGTDCCDRRYI